MIDVTVHFREAAMISAEWNEESIDYIHGVFEKTVVGAARDWDFGEGWGRILAQDRTVAYVCAIVPIVFVVEDYIAAARNVLSRESIVMVGCKSFKDKDFCVEKRALSEIIGMKLTSTIDYGCASIDDIWYATV